MSNFRKIVYLSRDDFNALRVDGSITRTTAEGKEVTIKYDPNHLYFVDHEASDFVNQDDIDAIFRQVAEFNNNKVNKAGDTMNGDLTVNGGVNLPNAPDEPETVTVAEAYTKRVVAGGGHTIVDGSTAEVELVKGRTVFNDESAAYHASISAIKATGKNWIPFPYSNGSMVKEGITWTVNSDGTVTANGTATAKSVLYLGGIGIAIPAGDVTISMGFAQETSGTSWMEASFRLEDGSEFYKGIQIGSSTTFTTAKCTLTGTYLIIASGVTVSNVVFKPMLSISDVESPYEPYRENIFNLPNGGFQLQEWDTFNPKTGELSRQTGGLTLVGAEDEYWGFENSTDYGCYRAAYSTYQTMPDAGAYGYEFVCNHYPTQNYDRNNPVACIRGNSTLPRLWFYLPYDTSPATDAAGWRAYLAELAASGKPLTVFYKQNAPTVTKFAGCDIGYEVVDGCMEMVVDDLGSGEGAANGAIPTITTKYSFMVDGDEAATKEYVNKGLAKKFDKVSATALEEKLRAETDAKITETEVKIAETGTRMSFRIDDAEAILRAEMEEKADVNDVSKSYVTTLKVVIPDNARGLRIEVSSGVHDAAYIDWGDGTGVEKITFSNGHLYTDPGIYTVTIYGGVCINKVIYNDGHWDGKLSMVLFIDEESTVLDDETECYGLEVEDASLFEVGMRLNFLNEGGSDIDMSANGITDQVTVSYVDTTANKIYVDHNLLEIVPMGGYVVLAPCTSSLHTLSPVYEVTFDDRLRPGNYESWITSLVANDSIAIKIIVPNDQLDYYKFTYANMSNVNALDAYALVSTFAKKYKHTCKITNPSIMVNNVECSTGCTVYFETYSSCPDLPMYSGNTYKKIYGDSVIGFVSGYKSGSETFIGTVVVSFNSNGIAYFGTAILGEGVGGSDFSSTSTSSVPVMGNSTLTYIAAELTRTDLDTGKIITSTLKYNPDIV